MEGIPLPKESFPKHCNFNGVEVGYSEAFKNRTGSEALIQYNKKKSLQK